MDLKKLQAEDTTLVEVIRAADRSVNDRNESVAEYFRREGLVYRRWTPKGRSSTFQVEQLVLPKRCRGMVLKLTHDVPSGGHLGREKTGRGLLRRFYWPTLFKDVAEFCRGCPTCQRSAQSKIKRAPLVPLPTIHGCLQSWGSQQECRCIVSCSKIVCCNRRRMIYDGCRHQEQFNLNNHARFDV